MIEIFRDWRFWAVLALLLSTTYVQIVGKHIELLTGANRLRNMGTYRYLFGGAPWVQWIMFRYGGLVQIACGIAMFVLFGWRGGILAVVLVLMFYAIVWRVAKEHGRQMLLDLQGRLKDSEDGNQA